MGSEGSKAFDYPGIFIEIPLVNRIRPRVKAWPEAGYPGVTSITERLLEHWRDPERILHIDSRVLAEAEAQEETPSLEAAALSDEQTANEEGETAEDSQPKAKRPTKTERAELLRRVVDTVGKVGRPGERIQKVISPITVSTGFTNRMSDPANGEPSSQRLSSLTSFARV